MPEKKKIIFYCKSWKKSFSCDFKASHRMFIFPFFYSKTKRAKRKFPFHISYENSFSNSLFMLNCVNAAHATHILGKENLYRKDIMCVRWWWRWWIITDWHEKNSASCALVWDLLPIHGIEKFWEKMESLIRLEGFWKFPASRTEKRWTISN